tara:strand:- start:5 stop:2155 length:2151 start_codon:yes stop_codon:yes gene_type:complete
MQKPQLYIDGQRVDMFEEVNITITDTLKNVKDVSKVFTEFSQTFSLPASKTNNKIFKHYYNSDIQNGFDARIRATAKIELNSIPYKDGYVKLEGVDLRNNNPHTYRITFFGNTVSLKNLLGDDLLSSLGSVPEGKINLFEEFSKKIDGTDLLYNSDDIETYLTTQVDRTVDGVVYSAPIQVPLLTHSQRLYYDSSEDIRDTGNVKFSPPDGYFSRVHGVKFNELKYALKLSVIIKAIEEKYGLNFSSDFFKGGDNSFIDLYMWLHRKKGGVISEDAVASYPKTVDGWSIASGTVISIINPSTLQIDKNVDTFFEEFTLTLTRPTTEPYSISVLRNGSVVYSEYDIISINKVIDLGTYSQPNAQFTVILTYSDNITFTDIKWEYINYNNFPYFTESYSTGSFDVENEFQFSISQQIPKMKVLDFLTSIFKMYNLIAYIEGGIVVVKDLDTFYAYPSTDSPYDITKFIDVNSSKVDSALPFREVDFSYKGLKTFLAKKHEQLFNEEWGTEEYKGEDSTILSNSIFKVEVPFEHMKFERLLDIDNPSPPTDIQYGYSVDDNQQSYIGQPLVFYMDLKTLPTTPVDKRISFVNSVNTVNDVPNVATARIPISSYYAPANSDLKYSQVEDRQSIHFSRDQDEWELTTTNETLFNNYHKNYISSVFNQSNRLTKVTAYLPLRILLKYTLADRFVIAGKSYKINSIKTDLQSGKSQLELLNDI